MNILITVGTTSFDELIKFCDLEFSKYTHFNITMQIAQGRYIPQNFEYFKFSNSIDNYYENADVIICHAGAGTIYKLLELQKLLIVVPNLNRVDNHQLEITRFLAENNFAYCCHKMTDLGRIIEKDIQEKQLSQYLKKSNTISNDIEEYIVNKGL